MKILWVKAGKLWPVDTGGKTPSFNILRHLARHHEVTLLSYYGGRRDVEYETNIEKQLLGAQTIFTAAPEATVAQSIDYILRLASAAPYAVKKFAHPKLRQEVARWLSNSGAEVAVCDFLSASLNFPESSPTPVVLFQHNVETMLWRRMAQTEKSALRKLSYRVEARNMAEYETRTLQRFRHVIAVSDHDRKEMLAMVPGCITVVPTGVDTEKYQPAPSVQADPLLIVFTGSMDWEPNPTIWNRASGGGLVLGNGLSDDGGAALDGGRYSIHDATIDDIDPVKYEGYGVFAQVSTGQGAPILHDVAINHVTAFQPG